jgi:hypothetical protein
MLVRVMKEKGMDHEALYLHRRRDRRLPGRGTRTRSALGPHLAAIRDALVFGRFRCADPRLYPLEPNILSVGFESPASAVTNI